MKKPVLLLSLILLGIAQSLPGQDIDTLYASKDAMIRYYNGEGDSTNYGNYEYINMHAWTNQLIFVLHRSLIDFDLSSIPPEKEYTATLKLFSDRYSTFYIEGHQSLQSWPRNDLLIQRITETWDEYEVNWFNRPAVTYENVVYVPPSEKPMQDYEIDVTDMVRDMLADPDI